MGRNLFWKREFLYGWEFILLSAFVHPHSYLLSAFTGSLRFIPPATLSNREPSIFSLTSLLLFLTVSVYLTRSPSLLQIPLQPSLCQPLMSSKDICPQVLHFLVAYLANINCMHSRSFQFCPSSLPPSLHVSLFPSLVPSFANSTNITGTRKTKMNALLFLTSKGLGCFWGTGYGSHVSLRLSEFQHGPAEPD